TGGVTGGLVVGPAEAMNATRGVLAATANAGLEMSVFGDARLRVTKVAMVGAVPCETTMATLLPPAALDPPAGVWLITLPPGTVVLIANDTETVKPALVSAVVAAACVWPTTFGTVTGGGPLETTSATDVPTSTVVPAAMPWLITVFGGTVVLAWNVIGAPTRPASLRALSATPCVPMSPSGRPVTSGTIVPSEITMSTRGVGVGGSVTPALGLVETTRPIGIVALLTDVTVPTTAPAFRIAVVAAACVRPMTFGMVTLAPGTGMVTSVNCSRSMFRSVSVPSEVTASAARAGTCVTITRGPSIEMR